MSEREWTGKGDARGYSWPQFVAGNEARMTHGAKSERRWRPIADRLAEDILVAAPWLARPAFRGALNAWAKAEAQAHLVGVWLDEHGMLDDDGLPRPAATYALRLDTAAASRRARLGLDPAALAKLLADFSLAAGADDVLSALRAEGSRILAQRPPEALPEAHAGAEVPENGDGGR